MFFLTLRLFPPVSPPRLGSSPTKDTDTGSREGTVPSSTSTSRHTLLCIFPSLPSVGVDCLPTRGPDFCTTLGEVRILGSSENPRTPDSGGDKHCLIPKLDLAQSPQVESLVY